VFFISSSHDKGPMTDWIVGFYCPKVPLSIGTTLGALGSVVPESVFHTRGLNHPITPKYHALGVLSAVGRQTYKNLAFQSLSDSSNLIGFTSSGIRSHTRPLNMSSDSPRSTAVEALAILGAVSRTDIDQSVPESCSSIARTGLLVYTGKLTLPVS
jgi:hypothetical protein